MELVPSTVSFFPGGALRVSHVRIADDIDYSQFSEGHLLHATLNGSTSRSAGRVGRGDWVRTADRRGSISFTPGGAERHGSVGTGQIMGAQFEFDGQFIEDACEQRLPANWEHAFNSADAKAFAIAQMAAIGASLGTCPSLTLDTLLLALARHIGRTYAKADRRRDDGWLHPAALARVIDQLLAEPPGSVALHELARTAGLGVSAFVRAFRGSTGATPAAFALGLRLDRVSCLLHAGDLGIGDIARQTGFASAAHLVRTFRVHRGITPGRLRRIGELAGIDGISRNPRKLRLPDDQDSPERA